MLSRRTFLAGLSPVWAQGAEPLPNIVFVTGDNLGYGDIGCYGNRVVRTPNLDRFASQGVRFTNFYTASPTCTASRAGLLTGRHPVRAGLNFQLPSDESKRRIGLSVNEKIIPAYLKPAGYTTGCFGKWNIGFWPGGRPTERGFDEFLGHRSGNIDYYTHLYNGELDLYKGTEPLRMEGQYATDIFAGAACDFIRRQARRPFFLYLPFNAVHYPNPKNLRPGEKLEWQAPEKYFRMYGYSPDEQDPKKRYHAAISALDDGFGRVVKQIEDLGLGRRTLIVFYSDNGAFMLKERGLEVASNLPLRSGGVTCWEGGIRVAGMARWTGRIPAGKVSGEMMSAMDLLPLALAASGQKAPAEPMLDGIDPTPVLLGKSKSRHDTLYFEYQKQQAVRRGRWKLIRLKPDEPWMLFDLDQDTGETKDLAKERPEVVSDLAGRFEQWRLKLPA